MLEPGRRHRSGEIKRLGRSAGDAQGDRNEEMRRFLQRIGIGKVFGRDAPEPRPAPFIVGCPRSGTTLLRLMLDAHPDLAIPPETGFLTEIVRMDEGSRSQLAAERFWGIITSYHTWGDFAIDRDDFKRELGRLHPFSVQAGLRLFYRLYARLHGKSQWGDKTPVYAHHMLNIHKVLPESYFIHIIRDGRDVALSLRSVWFSPGRDMVTLARKWCDDVLAARHAGKQCRNYLEIHYEDLVQRTAEVLNEICVFLELTMEASMLDYYVSAPRRLDELRDQLQPDGVTLITKQVRLRQQRLVQRPPDAERVGRWRKEMQADEVRAFEDVAGGLLKELGYECEGL